MEELGTPPRRLTAVRAFTVGRARAPPPNAPFCSQPRTSSPPARQKRHREDSHGDGILASLENGRRSVISRMPFSLLSPTRSNAEPERRNAAVEFELATIEYRQFVSASQIMNSSTLGLPTLSWLQGVLANVDWKASRAVCRLWNAARTPQKLVLAANGRNADHLCQLARGCFRDTQSLELFGLIQVAAPGLAALGSLQQLSSLALSGIRADVSLAPLSALVQLTTLEIRVSQISDANTTIVQHFSRLERLRLIACGCTSASFSYFAGCTKLRELDFSHNKFATLSLDSLRSLTNLESLGLIGALLNREHLATITALPNLSSLRISKVSQDEDASFLLRCSTLKDLQFGGLSSPSGFDSLSQMTFLKHLSFWWQGNSHAEHVERSLNCLENLESLVLAPGLFTFQDVPRIKGFAKLNMLYLNGLCLTSEFAFRELPALSKLVLYYCKFDEDVLNGLFWAGEHQNLSDVEIWGRSSLQVSIQNLERKSPLPRFHFLAF